MVLWQRSDEFFFKSLILLCPFETTKQAQDATQCNKISRLARRDTKPQNLPCNLNNELIKEVKQTVLL